MICKFVVNEVCDYRHVPSTVSSYMFADYAAAVEKSRSLVLKYPDKHFGVFELKTISRPCSVVTEPAA